MPKKELTSKQRERIIGAYLTGTNGLKISSNFNIPSSTVYDTINRYKKTGSPHPNKRLGRPKTLSNRGKRFLQSIIYKDRFASLGKITSQLNNDLSTNYHPNNIRKYLYEIKFKNCASRKKPLLTQKHQIDRLNWCKIKCNWQEEWKNIV